MMPPSNMEFEAASKFNAGNAVAAAGNAAGNADSWFWPESQASALTSGAASILPARIPRISEGAIENVGVAGVVGVDDVRLLLLSLLNDINRLLLSLLNGELGLMYFLLSRVVTPFLLIAVIS